MKSFFCVGSAPHYCIFYLYYYNTKLGCDSYNKAPLKLKRCSIKTKLSIHKKRKSEIGWVTQSAYHHSFQESVKKH